MYSLIVENESGEWLPFNGNRNYDLLSVTGANPPSADINTASVVGMDGTLFNSARANQRNIVLTVAVHEPIESNRLNLYNFFRIKRLVTLRYKTQYRDVYITGYVESIEVKAWSKSQAAQISIICPQPFWVASDDTTVWFSEVIALFEFPFSIPSAGIEFSRRQIIQSLIFNAGEIEVGGIIKFRAKASGVKNPIFYNQTTNKYFGVKVTMQANDIITINSKFGEKSVTLLRSGTETNLLANRYGGSEWLTFIPGKNFVSFDADEGASDLDSVLTITQKFGGV